jgi:zinc-ribbon domain
MFCSSCGSRVEDGDHFCNNCGAPLQSPGGLMRQQMPAPMASQGMNVGQGAQKPARRPAAGKPRDPYKDQIQQVRLQLKQLKLDLRALNTKIRNTRADYYEFDSFVQRGPVHGLGRMIEGAQLWNPLQQRKQLQAEIMQLEQQLLGLQQAQMQWKQEQNQG